MLATKGLITPVYNDFDLFFLAIEQTYWARNDLTALPALDSLLIYFKAAV